MYKNFFGFKEKPFKLVPNPVYLFLSRSHEEALAHLNYAVSQEEGFVGITGEVGTGKTTLCRAFLENLNDNCEAAYIFNPKLDSLQLLKTINDEFGIPSESENTKALIDILNVFLMSEKAKGKQAVLLIDEAQNLSHEVLEQIRLLSNLETTRSKLLQIILVGQPELGDMLNSQKLRQLGQRVTLFCSLEPLTYSETRDYIQHRLNIASRKSGIKFPRAAVQAIYKYSKGIPRLINIACDRTLLTAFSLNQHQITGKTATDAIKELTGENGMPDARLFTGNLGILAFSALCLALIVAILYPPKFFELPAVFKTTKIGTSEVTRPIPIPMPVQPSAPVQSDPQKIQSQPEPSKREKTDVSAIQKSLNETLPDPTEPKLAVQIKPAPQPEATRTESSERQGGPAIIMANLENWLMNTNAQASRKAAFKAAMSLWKINAEIRPYLETLKDDQAFFRLATMHNGFLDYSMHGDLNLVKKLNLPAIIEMVNPYGASPAYMTVCKIDDKSATLAANEKNRIDVSMQDINMYWTGNACIPWKNFLAYTGVIPISAPQDSVITLKMILKDIGFNDISMDPHYDDTAQEAVKQIQKKHGIIPDGVVGPLTKIILYNEHRSFEIPHIRMTRMEKP